MGEGHQLNSSVPLTAERPEQRTAQRPRGGRTWRSSWKTWTASTEDTREKGLQYNNPPASMFDESGNLSRKACYARDPDGTGSSSSSCFSGGYQRRERRGGTETTEIKRSICRRSACPANSLRSLALKTILQEPSCCLLIDNYDSFTYNLYQYLTELGAEVDTHRTTRLPSTRLKRWHRTHRDLPRTLHAMEADLQRRDPSLRARASRRSASASVTTRRSASASVTSASATYTAPGSTGPARSGTERRL